MIDDVDLSESCVENPCLNGGSCKKLGDDSLCQCLPFTSGFNCQQSKTQKSNILTIALRGGNLRQKTNHLLIFVYYY